MKPFFTLFICLCGSTCFAQKILVPYRSGQLFGLADGQGKIITAPAYSHISWLNDDWFKTEQEIILNDTIETETKRLLIRSNVKSIQTGLMRNGQVVLKNEPFDAYEVITGKCIVARYQWKGHHLSKEQMKKYGEKRQFFSLFNLKGKNVYPANFRSIRKIDTAGISSINKAQGRYILFITVDFDDQYNLIVYDADKQMVSDSLKQKHYRIQPLKYLAPGKLLFSFSKSREEQTMNEIDFNKGKLILKTIGSKEKDNIEKGESPRELIVTDVSKDVVPEPPIRATEQAGRIEQKRKPELYFMKLKDSLFCIESGNYEGRRRVLLPANAQPIFMQYTANVQYQPLIVRSSNAFYILQNEQPGTEAYDSLLYFGKYFLAWKKINGITRAGVINADGTPHIPFEYDSLYAGIRWVEFKNKNEGEKSQYELNFKEAGSKYYQDKNNIYKREYAVYITVFKNGQCGLLGMNGNTVLPIQYEWIAQNNIQHSKPREDEFIILKQNGRYGITKFTYNSITKQREPDSNFTVEPVWTYIPAFYYPDYYGIENLVLVGLYNSQFEFIGYAMKNGKVFYGD